MTNEMIEKYLVNKCDRVYGTQWEFKSLRDWIMVAWKITKLDEKIDNYIEWQYQEILELAMENIETSLGKPWSEVRAELRGWNDDRK